ncbi:MAG: ferritin-like domain-containing protein [Verrucomicrobiales bacterium]|nr:ferritin-like domain-containing protein [Verrucomicrobiales bacterium]
MQSATFGGLAPASHFALIPVVPGSTGPPLRLASHLRKQIGPIPSSTFPNLLTDIMKLDTLEKLLIHELKDLASAEAQLIDALPKMARAAHHPELREAFENHHRETRTHLDRLHTLFEGTAFSPGGHRCVAMAGLIDEAGQMIRGDAEDEVRDAGLVAAAQKIEHYEIAGYGTVAALADKLGMQEIAATLRETLEEEALADRTLTRLAERVLNFKAMIS